MKPILRGIKPTLIQFLVCISVLFSSTTPLPSTAHAGNLDSLFNKLCNEAGISAELVTAIAKHESGLHPLALNIAGKSYFPATKEEALRRIEQAHKAGKSYDVGLMQINRYWIERRHIPPESLLDPETNIRTGIKILAGEIERHGFTWKAVGRYHSPNEDRGTGYAWRIYNAHTPRKPSETTRNSRAEQETRHKNILLYRRNAADSGTSRKSGIVPVELR